MAFLDFLPLIGDAVNGIGSVISTSMANRQSLKNQREAQAWSEGMNEQQQQWQEKMWNLNNEYNSPAQQVDRLLSAGINPNSAVGGMSQAAASSLPQQPSIPGVSAAEVFPFDTASLRGLGDHLRQGLLFDTEKENIEADTKEKLAKAGTADAEAQLLLEQARGIKLENEFKPATLEKQLQKLDTDMQEAISRMQLNAEETNIAKYQLENILPLQVSKSLEEINEISTRIKELNSQMRVNAAMVADLYASAGLKGAQTENVKEQTKGLQIDNRTRDLGNRLRNLRTAVEIKHFRLNNEEKSFYLEQLRTFGMNISDNEEINFFVRLALLRDAGFADEVQSQKAAYMKKAGDLRHNGEDIFERLLDASSQIISGWVIGKAAGRGIRGFNEGGSSSSGSVTGKFKRYLKNNYKSNKYKSSSPSDWNPGPYVPPAK